jgi:hypothetical protein
MNRIIIIFFSLFFISSVLFAQKDGPISEPDFYTNPGWEYYSDNTLSSVASGKGYTGIAGLGDISFVSLNPASLDVNKKFQLYLGYTYKSSLDRSYYSPDLFFKPAFPSVFVGGAFRINKYLQAGLIYQNSYSYKVVFENFVYTNNEGQIIGIGEFGDKFVAHSLTVPIVFNYNWLRIGANLNITYSRTDMIQDYSSPEFPYNSFRSNLWRFNPKLGFIISPNKYFSFGGTFEPGFSDSTEWISDNPTYNTKQPVKYPNRISLGTELRLLDDKLNISLDYLYANTKANLYMKDMSNVHIGLEYKINETWKLRSGFFTLYDYRELDPRIGYGDELGSYDQYFITFGGTYKLNNFSFNLAFLDSHLLNTTKAAHTKITGGISYDF